MVLGYTGRAGTPSSRRVSPLGLVTKSGVWYLVAGTDAGIRTFRVGRVTGVTPTDIPVVRPDGFDLATAWEESAAAVEARRGQVQLRALAEPEVVPLLKIRLGTRLTVGSGTTLRVEWRSRSPGRRWAMLVSELAGFGGRVLVVDPPEARAGLARVAAELGRLYGEPQAGAPTGGPQRPAVSRRAGSSSQTRKSGKGMGRATA